MVLKDNEERDKLALGYAFENRKLELSLVWSRTLYFWAIVAVTIATFGAAFDKGHRTLSLLSACFGFLVSLCWTLANRGGKYWHEVWEKRTEHLAKPVVGNQIFTENSNPYVEESWCWGPMRYSPTRLATAVSDITALGWLMLIVGLIVGAQTPQFYLNHNVMIRNLIPIGTIFVAFLIIFCCRTGRQRRDTGGNADHDPTPVGLCKQFSAFLLKSCKR